MQSFDKVIGFSISEKVCCPKLIWSAKQDPVKAGNYKITEVVAKSVIVVMGGALVAMPLCFKQSNICASVVNQVILLFGSCSFNLISAIS